MSVLKHNFKPSLKIRPGTTYKSASGKIVEIFAVKENSTSSFQFDGYIITKTKLGRIKREWNIWGEDGRFCAVWGWSGLDLVEEVFV